MNMEEIWKRLKAGDGCDGVGLEHNQATPSVGSASEGHMRTYVHMRTKLVPTWYIGSGCGAYMMRQRIHDGHTDSGFLRFFHFEIIFLFNRRACCCANLQGGALLKGDHAAYPHIPVALGRLRTGFYEHRRAEWLL